MRMMLADGSVVRCSRDENAELFRAAAGGYGLLGVILEAELATVPDERYRLERSLVSAATLEAAFSGAASRPEAALAFGRLDVGAGGFLERGVFNAFRRAAPEECAELPSLAEPALAGLRRAIFRGTVGSEYGKRLRWDAETKLAAEQGTRLWRNQILDDDVTLYEDRSDATTELLEEYFVPEGRLEQFLAAARPILRGCAAELLNATVRHVRRDDDSLLRYADADMTAIVLLFHLERTAAADAAQAVTSRALIDAALALGGRYYLPYRPNATKAQLAAAYPQAARFFELKRRYDPGEMFVNRFYLEYGR
jgi:FAD/FMN-containing dehydrogenase